MGIDKDKKCDNGYHRSHLVWLMSHDNESLMSKVKEGVSRRTRWWMGASVLGYVLMDLYVLFHRIL